MRWWTRYVRAPFLRAWQEIPWLGPVISTVLVTLTISLLYDWLKETGGLSAAAVLIAIMGSITLVVVYTYAIVTGRRRSGMAARVSDKPKPPRCKGLIVMVSTPEIAREAIEYHKEMLRCCWLIVTPETKPRAEALKEQYEDVIPYVIIRPIANRYDTRGCYELVRDIYHQEGPRLGVEPGEMMADITGGTKPMTMGMILASLEGELPVEHIPTEFDPVTFKPKGPLPPIQIAVDVPPWASEMRRKRVPDE